MNSSSNKTGWTNYGRIPRFVTTTLVVPTTSLTTEFGNSVRDQFARTYSITIISTILFDLMVKTDAMELTPQELVEHVETVIVDDLGLATEKSPEFAVTPIPEILYELYRIFREIVWPNMVDHPIRRMTGSLQRVNYEMMEITFSRVETADGS